MSDSFSIEDLRRSFKILSCYGLPSDTLLCVDPGRNEVSVFEVQRNSVRLKCSGKVSVEFESEISDSLELSITGFSSRILVSRVEMLQSGLLPVSAPERSRRIRGPASIEFGTFRYEVNEDVIWQNAASLDFAPAADLLRNLVIDEEIRRSAPRIEMREMLDRDLESRRQRRLASRIEPERSDPVGRRYNGVHTADRGVCIGLMGGIVLDITKKRGPLCKVLFEARAQRLGFKTDYATECIKWLGNE